jgi:hypothetical protein
MVMHWMKSVVVLIILMTLAVSTTVIAQPQISGPQSGNLGPGTYLVVGDITVNTGQTLTIAPGTTFLQNGYRLWRIYGTLHAVGTTTDSIKWLRQQAIPEHRWAGIRFQQGAPTGNIMSYCVVEWGYTPTTAPATDIGGCIYSNGVPITVTNSRVSWGDAWWGGGGIAASNANGVTLTNNLICDNKDNSWKGGGILLEGCTDANVSYNVICRNQSTGT